MVVEHTEKKVVNGEEIVIEYNSDGTKVEKHTNKDGITNFHQISDLNNNIIGETKYEFDNNILISEKSFKNGDLFKEKEFYPNGGLKKSYALNHGIERTEEKNEDGETTYRREIDLKDNEVLLLEENEFYPNGKLKKSHRSRPKLEITEEKNEDGETTYLRKENSENDHLSYLRTTLHPNGKIATKTSTERGTDNDRKKTYNYSLKEEVGEFNYDTETKYNEDGEEIAFRKYNKYGELVTHRENGVLRLKSYINNDYDAVVTNSYNEQGKKIKETRKGAKSIWDENGNLLQSTNRRDDSIYEYKAKYNENGKMIWDSDYSSSNKQDYAKYPGSYKPFFSIERKFDENGKLTQFIGEQIYNEYIKTIVDFDEHERVIQALETDVDGNFISERSIKYSNYEDEERALDISKYRNGEVHTEKYKVTKHNSPPRDCFSYNDILPEREQISKQGFDKNGEIILSYEADFDSQGRKIIREFKCVDGIKTNRHYSFINNKEKDIFLEKFDANGKLLHKLESDIDSSKKSEIKFGIGKSSEETVWDEKGKKIFYQKIGTFGHLVELETYSKDTETTIKRHVSTNGEISEKHYKNGEQIANKMISQDGSATNNKTYYFSGRVKQEFKDDGVVLYWDNDNQYIKEKKDTNGKLVYGEYEESGKTKVELDAEGTYICRYESGEIREIIKSDNSKAIYSKSGKELLTIDKEGNKKANYDDSCYLLIAGRHCEKSGDRQYSPLTEDGKKQAENIGKLIAYAYQGKVKEMSDIILPEVYTCSNNKRSEETSSIIIENIEKVLGQKLNISHTPDSFEEILSNELSIHSLGTFKDVADDEMGSIAFTFKTKDLTVDRTVFNAEKIAEIVSEISNGSNSLEKIKNYKDKYKNKLELSKDAKDPYKTKKTDINPSELSVRWNDIKTR